MKMNPILPISTLLTFGLVAGMLSESPKSAAPIPTEIDHAGSPDHPRELGRVRWRRGFQSALTQARAVNKDLLILFQEVPGCATCVGYGEEVLSHPLIVDAVENEFIPLAVYNNISGDDRATLTMFDEPSSNNPVVRIISPDKKPLAERLDGDYTQRGIVTAMLLALTKTGRAVPEYLRLLKMDLDMQEHGLETATFAMSCFWTGEAELGALDGIASTKAGYLDGKEAVEVTYDPSILPYESLVRKAQSRECATTVFSRTARQQAIAKGIVEDAVLTSKEIRADREPKYYLAQTLLRFVPMTELQAARINSSIAARKDPSAILSPGQVRILNVIKAHPDQNWRNLIGSVNLQKSWSEVASSINNIEHAGPPSTQHGG